MSYPGNKTQLDDATKRRAYDVQLDIMSCLREQASAEQGVCLAAYLLLLFTAQKDSVSASHQEIVDGKLCNDTKVIYAIEKSLKSDDWERLKALCSKYTQEDFMHATLMPAQNDKEATPETVNELVAALYTA